MEVQRK